MLDRWSLIHAFNRLVKDGLAKPLTAPDGTEYIVRVGPDIEPVFWCSTDDSIMNPGLLWWSQLRDTIDRADIDSLDIRMLT